jgi:hypothetical protein
MRCPDGFCSPPSRRFFGFVALFLLNINLTAPHRLYGDLIARTFIQFAEGDMQPVALQSINPTDFAPYHLINATANLPSSTSPALRERLSRLVGIVAGDRYLLDAIGGSDCLA